MVNLIGLIVIYRSSKGGYVKNETHALSL